MQTQTFHITPSNIDQVQIDQAAALIKAGELVSFPTETVYGLGGNALSSASAEKIYAAKGRPSDNPLILHVANVDEVANYAAEVPDEVYALAKAFWPGPLTVVLKKKDIIPDESTGGLDTVAIRVPDHPIALALIQAAGCPLAAPSANLSGKPSPTTAEHVLEDLNGRIAGVIDGGPTYIGLESTVLDLAHGAPAILRHGGISAEQLKTHLPNLKTSNENAAHSPGTRYRHYSPNANVSLISDFASAELRTWLEEKQAVYIGPQELGNPHIQLSGAEAYAQNIFALLRQLDQRGVQHIAIESIDESGLGRAVMDRLRRAAGLS
ncbi:L-threonylcarbamoyladenylate synthase [Sanyastnella coralliicola]|uniref:L-threonylcarbamoyladenylate synthase n=1 Tax=Sanyastnella coralliicola TaxID=3069118 RepID=UPI0027BAA91A|nr:L-threonylcarbamoyladenylate synthase [Longitalea sp. SCSIO 12813]